MSTKYLIVELPEELKYRLDRYVLDRRSTIKEVVTELLENNVPRYNKAPKKEEIKHE